MKANLFKIVAGAICFVMILCSCSKNQKKSNNMNYTDFLKFESLTENSIYGFSYPGISADYTDLYGKTLIDGMHFSEEKSLNSIVGVDLVYRDVFNRTATQFFVNMDLRSFCDVSGVAVSIVKLKNTSLPTNVEFYYSPDGYSYSYYGKGSKLKENSENGSIIYGFISKKSVRAKMVKVVISGEENDIICLDEIDVRGKKTDDVKLLSKDAEYNFTDALFPENVANIILDNGLTDIDFSKSLDKNKLTHFATVDPILTASDMHVTQVLDLKRICNISEVCVRLGDFKSKYASSPQGIDIYVSEDGKNYTQYGMAYEFQKTGTAEMPLVNYRISKPYTQKARYIRLNYLCQETIMPESIAVFGFDNEIKQQILDESDKTIKPYTNLAINKPVIVNGKSTKTLTDGIFGDYDKLVSGWDKFVLNKGDTIKLGLDLENEQVINGICLEMRNQTIYKPKIEISVSTDNKNFKSLGVVGYSKVVAGKQLFIAEFENINARYVNFEISDILQKVFISELCVYGERVCEPFVRGGWLSNPVDDFSKNNFYSYNKYTENDWETLFYNMRASGMDYAVFGNIANNKTKTTIYPNPSVAGYKYYGTGDKAYAAADQLEAMLSAADKAGMKIFMGSLINIDMLFENYYKLSVSERDVWMNDYINECNQLSKEVVSRYSHHKSFYGFYLSDETCDEWLNYGNGEGVTAARKRYFGQAEYLRTLAPNKRILIAPAIWYTIDSCTSGPQDFANNVLKLIEKKNGNYPVDIIAFQDCLGRAEVSNSMYAKYESSISAVANALRGSGIEIWNDIEVFDPKYVGSKDYAEIEDSLFTGMKYSNTSLVFDIVHYFSYQVANLSDLRYFETDYIMREYNKTFNNYHNSIFIKK